MNLSATTPIEYSQGRLLQNNVKQTPTQDVATDDGCCTLRFFALGIVNARVYSFADMLLCRFVLDKGFQLHWIFCNHSKTSMYPVPAHD